MSGSHTDHGITHRSWDQDYVRSRIVGGAGYGSIFMGGAGSWEQDHGRRRITRGGNFFLFFQMNLLKK
jgi:hypothetical protein